MLRRQLYAGDQALRARSRRAFRTAATRSRRCSKARTRTIAPSETATAIAALRPLHPHLSQSSERRLRVLPEGPRQLPRGPGAARLRRTSSTCPSAIRRRCASRSPRSRSSSRSFPTASTPRTRSDADALPDQRARRCTRCTSRATTTSAAPTSRRPIARRRRCVNYPQTPANEDALDVLVRELRQARADAARATTRAASSKKTYPEQPVPRRRAARQAVVEILGQGQRPRRRRRHGDAARLGPKPWWQFW